MIIFKVILFFFIFITPLKANTIYNLIKIPNLEIYKINTKNGLRYLNATKPFRLGVNIKKNINCSNSDKKTLDEKYKIIKKNLDRYSLIFLKKINLKYVVLCENLSIAEINTAGIPNNTTRTLILDIKFNEKHFERAIHHELFHMINDSYKELFNENIWKDLNQKSFEYGECSTCNNNWNLDLLDNDSGFFTEYAKSTASEDMAEVFSHLMFYKKKVYSNDPIIEKKILFIKKNVLKIDNTFEF
ncbi:putative zinc-binding metallopeptidase [Candidatus Pelagibacter sp.]|nr:putative zinc-binding metallopeptidase [Candidatus Pelagibacter sp.]